MMCRIIKYPVLLFFCVICFAAKPMNPDRGDYHYYLSFCPQYLFVNGCKFSLNYRLKKSNWIDFSPVLYAGKFTPFAWDLGQGSFITKSLPGPGDQINGGAFNLEDKIFINKGLDYSGLYFKPGILYSMLSIRIHDYAFQNYTSNGVNYIGILPVSGTKYIERYGMHAGAGYAFRLSERLRADLFIGLGYYQIKSETDLPGYRQYKDAVFGYEYPGARFLFNMDLGYLF
jgi:hypothetical protein